MIPEELHDTVLKACVRIRSKTVGGSGTVIYSCDVEGNYSTYVLTNHHVVENSIRWVEENDPLTQKKVRKDKREQVEVHFFNYRWGSREVGTNAIKADILAYDRDDDLALLRLRGTDCVPLVAKLYPKGDEDKLRVGRPIYTVGCGLGEPPVVTGGFISVFGKEIEGKEYWICTAPAIYGNSGGGTFLEDTGEFIGVPSRVAVTGFLGQSVVTHLQYVGPITRVYDFLEKQMFRFIYDDTFTEAGEEAERKKLREAERKNADDS